MGPLVVYHPLFAQHLTGLGHPGNPKRYTVSYDALSQHGLLSNSILSKKASLDDLQRCHSLDYIDLVQKECAALAKGPFIHGEIELSTGDVKISPESYEIALLAAGSGIVALDAIMNHQAKEASALSGRLDTMRQSPAEWDSAYSTMLLFVHAMLKRIMVSRRS